MLFIFGRFWFPKWTPKWFKKLEKSIPKPLRTSTPILDRFQGPRMMSTSPTQGAHFNIFTFFLSTKFWDPKTVQHEVQHAPNINQKRRPKNMIQRITSKTIDCGVQMPPPQKDAKMLQQSNKYLNNRKILKNIVKRLKHT